MNCSRNLSHSTGASATPQKRAEVVVAIQIRIKDNGSQPHRMVWVCERYFVRNKRKVTYRLRCSYT